MCCRMFMLCASTSACIWVCNLTLLDEGLVQSKHQTWSTCEGLRSILAQAALDHKDSESEKCKV